MCIIYIYMYINVCSTGVRPQNDDKCTKKHFLETVY